LHPSVAVLPFAFETALASVLVVRSPFFVAFAVVFPVLGFEFAVVFEEVGLALVGGTGRIV